MLNGEGLRVTLFVSGCSHNCKNCQNPQTHSLNSGIEFDIAAIDEIFTELKHPYIDGITFSGGDPLHPANRKEVYNLCKLIKKTFCDKSIWIYTGFRYEQISNLDVLKYIDILVDGEYIEAQRNVNLPYRGSVNQRLIDVQKSIQNGKVCLFDIG